MTQTTDSFELPASGPIQFKQRRNKPSQKLIKELFGTSRRLEVTGLRRGKKQATDSAGYTLAADKWTWSDRSVVSESDLMANSGPVEKALNSEVEALNAALSLPVRSHLRALETCGSLPLDHWPPAPSKPANRADAGVQRAWRRRHDDWLEESIGRMSDAAPETLAAHASEGLVERMFARLRLHLELLDWPVPMTWILDQKSSEKHMKIVFQTPPALMHVGPRVRRDGKRIRVDTDKSLSPGKHKRMILVSTALSAAFTVSLYLRAFDFRMTIGVTEAVPEDPIGSELARFRFEKPFWVAPTSDLKRLGGTRMLEPEIPGFNIDQV